MASDPDIDELRMVTADLAAAARELSDVTRNIADAARSQSNSSTVHIDAGGVSAGVALAGVGMCVVTFMLFAIWVMWQVADIKGQQESWIQVWQQRVANETRKE